MEQNNSKLETMEISDKSTNPRCRSQAWQHFGFKVTYKDSGLSFKSSSKWDLPGIIPSQTRNRKQTNPMRYVK